MWYEEPEKHLLAAGGGLQRVIRDESVPHLSSSEHLTAQIL
jgi:hypothetical protein